MIKFYVYSLCFLWLQYPFRFGIRTFRSKKSIGRRFTMCKTYTQLYGDCAHIYGVQTKLCSDREREIGAEKVPPSSCPNYRNAIARPSTSNPRKKPKIGKCELCAYLNASSERLQRLADDSPPMIYSACLCIFALHPLLGLFRHGFSDY